MREPRPGGTPGKAPRRRGEPRWDEGRRILLCDRQRPFRKDPLAPLVEALADRLVDRGYTLDHARVPAAVPGSAEDGAERAFRDALAWRLLDLSAGAGQSVDLLLALRFPAWAARHPNKVVWLLDGSPEPGPPGEASAEEGSAAEPPPSGRGQQWGMARYALGEARRLFVPSAAAGRALKVAAGLEAVVLEPPAPAAGDEAWDPVLDHLTDTL